MIKVENIDLSVKGVDLPFERVGFVIAQPFLSLTANEPFICDPIKRDRQLKILKDTLEVAKARPHGEEKTHFTIFPEYSVPGFPGIQAIEEVLKSDDWPAKTVVIAGVDGLSKGQYGDLIKQPKTSVSGGANAIDQVGDTQWVNCSIVWIKDQGGEVERWIQPKIYPAWEEQNIKYEAMFRGKSINLYRGKLSNNANYRFSLLLCFDWIAKAGSKALWYHVLEELEKQSTAADGAETTISWFFVIQHNSKPNHPSFLSQVPNFFDQTSLGLVRRERASIVFANTAGRDGPGRTKTHGATSCIFSGNTLFDRPTCMTTFSSGGPRFRGGSEILKPFDDIFFREGGECILSFAMLNPGALKAGAEGRKMAIENAEVFPIGGIDDPRVPSAPVPASVKWLNDELDEMGSITEVFPQAPLNPIVLQAHAEVIKSMRQTQASVIGPMFGAGNDNADLWGTDEFGRLELLVHVIEILGASCGPQLKECQDRNFKVKLDGHPLEVMTFRGRTHQECVASAQDRVGTGVTQSLIVTKDRENTKWDPREGSFLSGKRARLGQEGSITEPGSNVLHISYQELLVAYEAAQSPQNLCEALHAKFA